MLLDPGPTPPTETPQSQGVFLFNWAAPEHWIPIALTATAIVIWVVAGKFRKVWAAMVGINAVVLAAYTIWCARNGMWLPENASALGEEVDYLFYLILVLITIFYVITQGVLIYTMIQKPPEGGRSKPVHGNHTLELVWTLIPGALLVYIAVAQLPTWAKMKGQNAGSLIPSGYEAASDPADLLLTVTGKQWEWRMRYAHPDSAKPENPLLWATTPAPGDIHAVNEIHAWKGAKVRLMLRTTDVIHSLFLPQFRFKQDMLPGKTIPTLLHCDRSNVEPNGSERPWEIACAELCGGNHYRMRGKVVIHPDRESFLAWLNAERAKQSARKETVAAAPKTSSNSVGNEE